MSDGRPRWLNRTVVGTGLTSLLADLSYETVFSVLPGYVDAIGAGRALGPIEGAADALASFVKLGSGWWSDRIDRRKPFAVAGYVLTGVMPALIAVAVSWPLILVARLLGWLGKGLRGPARDALLAASVPAADRGKAFGLHRTSDTVGAVLGPLLGVALLRWFGTPGGGLPQRYVLWAAVVPGVMAAVVFALLVREVRGSAVKRYQLNESVRRLPAGFRRYLVAVGVFGAGDFSHVLLIAAAAAALTPAYGPLIAAQWAAFFYAVRNFAAALTAFPVGALSDRVGRLPLLRGGYFFASAVMASLAAAVFAGVTSPAAWAALFALAGVFIATEEALEGAAAADFVADSQLRGTAFGLLGAVNGVGDWISSTLVGLLAVAAPAAGFLYAACMMAAGAVILPKRGPAVTS